MNKYRPGDVLTYTPEKNWCREGMAVVASTHITDTYWDASGDNHVLTEKELLTASVLFSLDDFEEVARYNRDAPADWLERAPEDRQRVTSQHGLSSRWYIRKGSTKDLATIRQNLAQAVKAAEEKVESSNLILIWARQELDRFDSEQVNV